MFLLFGLFIVACGATHLMEIWTLWTPNYWLADGIKAVTAAASVPTAILLYMLVPQALALPSTRQLRESNEALEREVAERQRVERVLREAQAGLETRVAERTAELSHANALLEKAHRRQSEFLAILTHELRNPAHAIHASSQYLTVRAADPDVRENAAIIARQVSQLSRLLDDLTSVVRNEYEPARLNKSALDLRDAVTQALETVRGLITERNQQLAVELPAAPVTLHADTRRLIQAIVNLVRNASLYSDAGAPITVSLSADETTARLVVQDRGIGFDGEDAARLFELFARSAEARRRAVGGLGIGLHVAKLIVDAHGGSIAAASAGRGVGSSFTVTLPLSPAAPSR
jgi:signal transduction histidine kinase